MKGILAKMFGARAELTRRRGVGGDKEMPFLEHLEELRQTLVKIIATLIVVTIAAFVFRAPLMEAIKRPVELAGLGASIELPADVSKVDWRKVQTLARTSADLDSEVRRVFLDKALGEEDRALRLYVRALSVFNATLVLEEGVREDFVNQAISDDPELRETILRLVRLNPEAKVDRQGNLIQMSALRPPEAFMLSLKISMIAGVILAFPLLLYFIAQFVFPGLTSKEKRAVIPAVAVGFLLFLTGASFAYWVVTPRVLEFFHGYADELGVDSEWRIGYYVSFVSQLVLIFGLSFELPVVVMTLVKLDLLGYRFMARNRSYAIVIIFTVAALITPTPDAPTLCLLAVPMVILYEFCIWMAYFIDRRRRREEAEEEAENALRRQKRAQAREIALPKSPPSGTVSAAGSGGGGIPPASDPPTASTDEGALRAFDENDALLDEHDRDMDFPRAHEDPRPLEEPGATETEDGFEPGFEPKTSPTEGDRASDEAPDLYSSEDFHNAPYQEPKPSPGEDVPGSESSPAPEVDEPPSKSEKEKEPPASDPGSEDPDTPPSSRPD